MKIVIIGSGNVAAVLGRKLKAAGHDILQVMGRNAAAASALAYEWDTESANYMSLLNKQADVYLIAVSDQAIGEVIKELRLPGKVVAHTAGSVDKEILKNVTAHFGVFYPLQSLRKEAGRLPEIPLFFEGKDEKAARVLESLAHSISQEQVAAAAVGDRQKLHVAAVIVNNFTTHLYALAEDYCRKEGIDFRQLIPLIEETAMRMRNVSPSQTMTGPAIRNDAETVQKHLELLQGHPHLQKVYEFLTASIRQMK